jgi:ParB-like chromosome segregation protein Spo0J
MTATVAAPLVWERLKVSRGIIALDPAFKTRRGRLNVAHVKTLAAAIRRGGALSPITLWRQEGRNSLTLLDGEHRLAAYRAAGWRGGIPARVATFSRKEALLVAASANTRDALPLSQSERADVAWRLVREPDACFSKRDIARASGVSTRTIATMRDRWRTFQISGGEPSGDWWQDRKEGNEEGDRPMMTDAERLMKVEALAEKMRKAAGNVAFRDEQMFAEALDKAFGSRLRAVIDFLYSPDEVDEWQGYEVPESGADGDDDQDGSAF